MSELKSAYPLQLSVRMDESRKCIIFDCFEFKPQCIDMNDPDMSKFYPTGRDWDRWTQAYREQDIDIYDDEYKDDDDDPYYTEKMKASEEKPFSKESEKVMIFCSMAGAFAYSRCLRFRFPFNNIVGICLKSGEAEKNTNKKSRGNDDNTGAVLIIELNRPPPANAFAARKVASRWTRENDFVLTQDWTPDSAASEATRIYLYGGLAELKQTVALMSKLWPPISVMLAINSGKHNSLLGDIHLEYSASPEFKMSGNVTYGSNNTKLNIFDNIDSEDEDNLRSDRKTAQCDDCGTVYYRGYVTGYPCTGCGDGRMTRNFHCMTELPFNGQLDNAVEVFEANCKRRDSEKQGSSLKRKAPA